MRFYMKLGVLSALLLMACGDKSAVSLSADIPNANVNVEDNAFGAALTGTFELTLALGPEASAGTSVTVGNFALQSTSGASLVDVLSTESSTAFPLFVDKGSSRSVTFTVPAQSIDTPARSAICAGQVRLVGSVMDSLSGHTDPVSSALVTPNCGSN